jgi:cytoskeletal protein CcmA (bactofilin family)
MKQNIEEINVFWGKDSAFNGKIISQGIFRLDGKMEGEILHDGTLIIGETAVIKGKIEVNALTLNGVVEGEVTAKERVEIHPKGKLYGTLSTPILVVQDGGIFEGNCKMGGETYHKNELEGSGVFAGKHYEELSDRQ